MTKATAIRDHAARPCPRPASMELTPVEFDHYMRAAHRERDTQRVRAEAMAGTIARWFAGFGRLFTRPGASARIGGHGIRTAGEGRAA